MRLFALIAAIILAGSSACKSKPPAVAAAPRAEAMLVENARIVLEKHCGQCHISTYETALPRALAIFDLADDTWNTHLTREQLASAKARIDATETLEGEPSEVTPEERTLIARFVAQELEARDP